MTKDLKNILLTIKLVDFDKLVNAKKEVCKEKGLFYNWEEFFLFKILGVEK